MVATYLFVGDPESLRDLGGLRGYEHRYSG
jgi:hypothetical protein